MSVKKTTKLGKGMLSTSEEYGGRNESMVNSLSELVDRYLPANSQTALDIGCQQGNATDLFAKRLNLCWTGIDPVIKEPQISPGGANLIHGYAHQAAFPDHYFDCLILANVFEHIDPKLRIPSFTEMRRVLKAGGILVGQLPNPYFPIESHSRLPFMGWLPLPLRRLYWKVAPVPWSCDQAHFFAVTIRQLKGMAEEAGFETLLIRTFNYPLDVIPASLRGLAKIYARLPIIPWSWQFAFKRG
jgi:SAM-dependent methyltransferase